MQYNLFQEYIIQNLDDMEEALSGFEKDEFYVMINFDRGEGGFKAHFYELADGAPIASTEEWGTDKKALIEDIQSVFGEEVDIEL